MYDNNKGLVFVKYRTLTETINCLKGVQNIINILPQKDKIDSTSKEIIDQDTNLQTSIKINSSNTHNRISPENGNQLVFNMRSNSLNRFDKIDASSNNFRNSKYGSASNVNIEKDNKSIFVCEKRAFSLRQESCINDVFDFNYIQEPSRSNISSYSLTKCDANYCIDNIVYNDSKIPNLIDDTEIEQEDFSTASNCSLLADLYNASSKIFIMPMQEVIVVNIHANYDMHYILHLFKKYNPLAATSVKTISETNIRYCHVYFETIQNAIAVEKEFDKFFLFGKSLIVLRKLQLIKEAENK